MTCGNLQGVSKRRKSMKITVDLVQLDPVQDFDENLMHNLMQESVA
jgi:hypothetical protein